MPRCRGLDSTRCESSFVCLATQWRLPSVVRCVRLLRSCEGRGTSLLTDDDPKHAMSFNNTITCDANMQALKITLATQAGWPGYFHCCLARARSIVSMSPLDRVRLCPPTKNAASTSVLTRAEKAVNIEIDDNRQAAAILVPGRLVAFRAGSTECGTCSVTGAFVPRPAVAGYVPTALVATCTPKGECDLAGMVLKVVLAFLKRNKWLTTGYCSHFTHFYRCARAQHAA
jgi:hypothetical protein